MNKSLKFISGEDIDLNLYNSHTLVNCVFLETSCDQIPTLPTPSCLWMEMVFKVMAWVIWGSYSAFLGISHVYRKYTCY